MYTHTYISMMYSIPCGSLVSSVCVFLFQDTDKIQVFIWLVSSLCFQVPGREPMVLFQITTTENFHLFILNNVYLLCFRNLSLPVSSMYYFLKTQCQAIHWGRRVLCFRNLHFWTHEQYRMNKKYSRGPLLQPIDVNRKTSVAFTQMLSDQKTCIQRVVYAYKSFGLTRSWRKNATQKDGNEESCSYIIQQKKGVIVLKKAM